MRPLLEIFKLCECGCGQEVKPGNRFILGHNSWNKGLTKEDHPGIASQAKKISEFLMGHITSKITGEKIGNALRKREYLGQLCECGCGQWTAPGRILRRFVNGHNQRGIKKPKEFGMRLAKLFKGRTYTKETLKLMSEAKLGPKCSNWKGGISREPYAFEWTKELRKQIRERDNYQCQNPYCQDASNNDPILNTHHIDYDKKNCDDHNLIILCNKCNGGANFNRDYWKDLYQQIVINKYKKAI